MATTMKRKPVDDMPAGRSHLLWSLSSTRRRGNARHGNRAKWTPVGVLHEREAHLDVEPAAPYEGNASTSADRKVSAYRSHGGLKATPVRFTQAFGHDDVDAFLPPLGRGNAVGDYRPELISQCHRWTATPAPAAQDRQ